MAEKANITSVDALEAFRADLILYLERAKTALGDAEGEVRQTRTWLEVDRKNHWMRELKLRTKRQEQAEAEFYNAKITRPKENHSFHKMAVAKAQREVGEAMQKLEVIKRWRQRFDNQVMPLVRRLDPMMFMAGQRLPQGVRSLGELIKALQNYTEKAAGRPVAPAPENTEVRQ